VTMNSRLAIESIGPLLSIASDSYVRDSLTAQTGIVHLGNFRRMTTLAL